MRVLFFTLLTFSFFVSNAQQKPFEHTLGWRGGGSSNPIFVKSITDSAKTTSCVLAKSATKTHGFVFDENMRLVKDFESDTQEGNLVGGFIRDNKAYVYLKNDRDLFIRSLTLSLDGGPSRTSTLPFDPRTEKIIGRMNASNSFIYITAEKKNPVMKIYRFTGGSNVEEIRYDLGREDLNTGLQKNDLWIALSSGTIGRSIDVAIVDPQQELAADVADSPNKLYLRNDTLTLLIDRNPAELKIFELSLISKEVNYRTIKRNYPTIPPGTYVETKFNSFLIEDRVYFVHATPLKLSVSVYDFHSGALIKSHVAEVDGTIDFKNTPVIQEGGGTIYSSTAARELVKTKQLLRKMLAGNALISVTRNKRGEHEVTIGAFKLMKQGGGYMPMGGAMGGAFASGMPMAVGFQASWNRVTRFKMLTNPLTAEHIPGEMKASVYEEIEDYAKNIKLPEDGSSVFIGNGFYQFAYYDREERKLVVLNF